MTIAPFLRLCLVCLLANSLFIDSALARLSDQKKQDFIERLAELSKERKVFYRWQSETSRQNLLDAGEMTPQLYKYFSKISKNDFSGAGLYAAEDPSFSSHFGETLIQIEIEPGYRFLDLTDSNVREQLRKAGITHDDVYKLNPRIAVKNTLENPWWVLKEQKGIKFTPFSSQRINLDTLVKNYNNLRGEVQREFFKDAIREDILRRAEKSIDVFGSSLVEIVGGNTWPEICGGSR